MSDSGTIRKSRRPPAAGQPRGVLAERPSVSIFRKRLRKFRTIKRGYYSFLVLLGAYGVSFFLPLLINSNALVGPLPGQVVFPHRPLLPGGDLRPADVRRAGLPGAGADVSPAATPATGC